MRWQVAKRILPGGVICIYASGYSAFQPIRCIIGVEYTLNRIRTSILPFNIQNSPKYQDQIIDQHLLKDVMITEHIPRTPIYKSPKRLDGPTRIRTAEVQRLYE